MAFGRFGTLGRLGGLGSARGVRVSAPTGSPYTLNAATGSFAMTGNDAGLVAARAMPAAAGSFALTGQDATLTYSGGGSLGLQTNLTAFWSFEDTSWTDDTGNGSTLTGTGSPASSSTAPAKVGNYLSLNGSSYLSAGSNTNLVTGSGSFSVQCWVYTPAPPGAGGFMNKDNNVFGQKEWSLGTRFTSANKWDFTVYNTSTTQFPATSTTTVATSTWTHLVGTFNSSTGAVLIYVNGSVDGSGATLTGTVQSTASAPFNIGRLAGGTGIANGHRIDQCGFWKGRVLSASDVTALYNSGNGLSYAAMA
jgi:hypothetical protein